ncbi:VOC family protein [Sandaracinobacteroides saxicola]|uniref:VOC family protein n=1 Tax=Sandaracinobacteroides saxicola TaxID=2759707 RepID=A0A7G5IL18_9SPHN|nr:VOC family protein [Sandaracinobacteroides saxicola]QMW24060.1 VOC family protein [Sandaracinobacteroides saxicola]
MFSHVMLGAKDLEASRAFYDGVLAVLGASPGSRHLDRYFWRHNGATFGVSIPIDGEPATHGNGSTLGFACADPATVDAFHAAGLAHGGTACENPPGVRDGSAGKLYLAYLRDPAGNKICALHRL